MSLSAFLEFFAPTETHDSECAQSLAREILFSYRVLFAQTSRSRKLLRRELVSMRRTRNEIDPFLEPLCCQKLSRSFCSMYKDLWPPSCQDFEERLQEHDVYSAKEDFPFLGARLLRIQQYNLRQQPSRIRDLWRDRRNPLQWYTFWAVLWIGGITIVLGSLQVVIAAAQLYYAKSSQPGPQHLAA